MNREARTQAKMKLEKLTQGQTKMHDHLATVESLLIQAGIDVFSEYGLEYVFKTLNPDVKLNLQDTFLLCKDMKGNYNEIKKYLKAKETNRLVSVENDGYTVSISGDNVGYDPMDIGSFAGQTQKIKWTSLDAEKWKILKETLIKLKCCLVCRDYVEFGHQENSSCKLKTKKFDEIFLNRSDENYRFLLTFSTPSCAPFVVPIEVSGIQIKGMVDTGALGDLFIDNDVVRKCKVLERRKIPPLNLIFFGGNVDQVAREKVKLEFIIQGCKFKEFFIVLPRCSSEIIIGLKWLASKGAIIDCESKTLGFKLDISSCIPEFAEDFKEVFDVGRLKYLPPYKETFAIPIELENNAILPPSAPYKLSIKEEEALKKEIKEGIDLNFLCTK